MLVRFVFFVIGVFFVHVGIAQDCFNYHVNHCQWKSKFTYQTNDASISFLFKLGDVKSTHFTLYDGKDYRFILCADTVFNDVIRFQIADELGNIIYDNSNHNFNLNMEFTNKKTQEVELILEVPAPAFGVSDTISTEGCIGLLIEEMVSIKTGF